MVDIVGLGEICIDWVLQVERFPEPDEKIFYKKSEIFPGGVTANYVTALARLGANVGFIGGVGKDHYGNFLISKLNEEGIDTSLLKRHNNRNTAVNILAVNKHGEKIIFQDPNLKENVPDPMYLDEKFVEYLKNAVLLHTTGIKLETSIKAAKIAKKSGKFVSFDLEKHVAEYGIDKIKELLKYTDLLLPNKLGIRQLTDTDDLVEAAFKMKKYGPNTVVITLGDKGCMIITDENTVIEVPAFKVKAIDTTGAGDAFNAAFTYSFFVKKWDYKKAALFANATAAIKCTKMGAQTGLPRYDEVLKFLKERNVYL